MPDGSATQASTPVVPARTIPAETISTGTRSVACDGGNGALGHPRVFLRITGTSVTCPYCSRVYVLAADAADGDAH